MAGYARRLVERALGAAPAVRTLAPAAPIAAAFDDPFDAPPVPVDAPLAFAATPPARIATE